MTMSLPLQAPGPHHCLIGPLPQLFQGELAAYGAALAVADAVIPAGTSLDAFLDGPQLQAALALFALRFPGAHPKALASTWSKLYFNALLVPVLAASAACGWCFPLAPGRVRFLAGADGAPLRFLLEDEGAARPGLDSAARLQPLVRGHMAPVVDALARQCRLAPRLLWNNAAVIAEETLLQCRLLMGSQPRIAADLDFLCATAQWPDQLANPMHQPTRLVENVRQRQLCCLRYRLQLDFCADCPLDCRQRQAAQRKLA
ncbi:siderophore-iron reductase FhuF [Janthinobacterium lividum]|uniref:siderophore-iron reductase FhuF n=1 Tax=Janthinobacterium lividum TaxID=29581 RepID=UPI000DFBFCF5|nr:siderophore-iron reductase FhuF [Janthinobacterium lividum]MCC7717326.1 siderophore-iron reductase FhuF [Janthinobacterium lividum]WQE31813.1 siderophore-iron reductase FhuF [Janthinobacterium lividum]STS86079.1 ferric iron reductase involved in ferric hydroximate transport [Janthinobacterium lividum]